MESGAVISLCGCYRYSLWRKWNSSGTRVLFIGLNPSTANGTQDDPTVRRCVEYARSWGFGGMYLCNLFAFRATNPKVMKQFRDPVGPDNDCYILETSKMASLAVAIWGNHGRFSGRSMHVIALVKKLHCLKTNKTGAPAHPLYLPRTLRPVRWEGTC